MVGGRIGDADGAENVTFVNGREYIIRCLEGYEAVAEGVIWRCESGMWTTGRDCLSKPIRSNDV